MFVALILCSGAFALIAWLAFNFAVYALPFLIGISVARLAYSTGAGLIGAGLVGLIAGGASFGLGQFALASARSPIMRAVVSGLFTLPAGVAGYWSTYGAVQLCTTSEGWRQAFALAGALAIAAISHGRLAAFAPLRVERDARAT